MSHAISLSNVSVKYILSQESVTTFQEHFINFLKGKPLRKTEFCALSNVSFSVARGDSLGIVGCNGSGKSTLLKVVSGIIRPTEGVVWTEGRLAPLIELGAGFDSELTGEENIYLNGSLLGLSRKQIKAKFDEIVGFAELPGFIYMPLRTYSSGMLARLAFSIAVAVDAEILIVDEVLSVGDEAFRKKCHYKIEEILKRGVTLLYVSHSLGEVQRLCNNALWLDRGGIAASGESVVVTRRYQVHSDGQVFEDIKEGHPDKKCIDALFTKGITSGYDVQGRRYYNPHNRVTRAELAVFLSKAMGMEKSAPFGKIFDDVPESHWAGRHIIWVFQRGIMEGVTDDKARHHFRPDDYVAARELRDALSRIDPYRTVDLLTTDGETVNRGEVARVFYRFFDFLST